MCWTLECKSTLSLRFEVLEKLKKLEKVLFSKPRQTDSSKTIPLNSLSDDRSIYFNKKSSPLHGQMFHAHSLLRVRPAEGLGTLQDNP